ncbi:MBOAT family O-acyltransferase [Pseudahrensia aquimaris]|uniref:Probable alginate O-acetylase AlgI n=1 Tax=Pseudahrensia aquimaris TaxID=744461 RepID=A0ABW3FDV7_9HYPH
MLFPTITFAVFFCLVFWAAWTLEERLEARKALLLGASYVFYGWWDWRFCALLAGASLVAWLAGLRLSETNDPTRRKRIVALACAALLIVLGFFKYYGFFLSSLQDAIFALGLERDLPFLEIILPVGISFFTFQAISYVVDVFRGDVEARRSPLDVLLYISFFPQLVAGPIVRASAFLPQLERPQHFTRRLAAFGLTLVAVGLFKKMVVANTLATSLVDPIFIAPSDYSSLMLLIGIYGYAVQIYCDFSGYSDIAIGTAALLGFRFKPNFDQPYRAQSLQDFWRRWHISLSQWLRDYLYIPLGGSRLGEWKTLRNVFLTMFLGGLWHGAAWTFIIWGSIHGFWLVMERAAFGGGEKRWGIVGWFVTFHLVCAAWVFFRAEDLSNALQWFAGFGAFDASLAGLTWLSVAFIAGTLALQFVRGDMLTRIASHVEEWPVSGIVALFFAVVVLTVWLAPEGTAPFIYFQF